MAAVHGAHPGRGSDRAVLFHGEQGTAQLLVGRAIEKYKAGDIEGALEDLDAAAEWAPEMPQVYELRCEIRMAERNDLEGAEADANKLIELSPEYAQGYTLRSQVYQHQTFADPEVDRHREAIDDLTTALKLSFSGDPMKYNNLAYGRALAGLELQEGLEDAERAVELLDEKEINKDHPLEQISSDGNRAAALDTRGYLHHLLGNDEQALADLNEAVTLTERSAGEILKLAKEKDQGNVAIERMQRGRDHTLAVLLQHRGEIHKKLGNDSEAEADFAKAQELGYDPAAGVF